MSTTKTTTSITFYAVENQRQRAEALQGAGSDPPESSILGTVVVMASTTDISDTVLLNPERELVCFICTEIFYQPLSLLDCLHSFCGACLKEWFSHQYRKASNSSSSSTTTNPYTCPTCRAPVKGTKRNALVNTFLDMFLTANPGRARTQEDKTEMERIYKPGDDILPKVEGRRRERRSRREEDTTEARERRMVAEAQERSLREIHGDSAHTQTTLRPPSSRQGQSSRSRDREERRERRRDREHDRQPQRQQQHTQQQEQRPHITEDQNRTESTDHDQQRRESLIVSAPASSPRHPEAVEARQREQTVVHQPSLTSLISSSESGIGSNDTDALLDPIMQEILAEGLLDGIDVNVLTETEQEALAESVARAYRQRLRERNYRNNPSSMDSGTANLAANGNGSNTLHVEDHRRNQREESFSSRQRRADTIPPRARAVSAGQQPRSARTLPTDTATSTPPQSSIVFTHRRRTSSHGNSDDQSRNRSRQSSPGSRSATSRPHSSTNVAHLPQQQDTSEDLAPQVATGENQQQAVESISIAQRDKSQDRTQYSGHPTNGFEELQSPRAHVSVLSQTNSSSQGAVELPGSEAKPARPTVKTSPQSTFNNRRRASGLYDEPSVSCMRCQRADIQYSVYKHCEKCKVDLCMSCYRNEKCCLHWYGYGYDAMARFQALQPASYESMELPHALILGRQYRRPEESTVTRSKLAKDGTIVIPTQTTSNPAERMLEGRFCDRCSKFANACFWACDYCNFGEWGFCRECVNTHHCCTHPLLPTAHKSLAPTTNTHKSASDTTNTPAIELLTPNLRPSPAASQPSSATSAVSLMKGPFPDFVQLVINTHCDICSQSIDPLSDRFHCPSHPTPTPDNPDACGDYDICTTCYQNLVKTNRIKRDDGSAGWCKCPFGHRMIITTFEVDSDGGQRRVVKKDLVGGWKSPAEAMQEWQEARREYGSSGGDSPTSPDGPNSRRSTRVRTSSYSTDPAQLTNTSPFSSSSKFPPDGGAGLRGVARCAYFPEDAGPNDLVFPRNAEIRELKMPEGYPDWYGGVYAGDRGLVPADCLWR